MPSAVLVVAAGLNTFKVNVRIGKCSILLAFLLSLAVVPVSAQLENETLTGVIDFPCSRGT